MDSCFSVGPHPRCVADRLAMHGLALQASGIMSQGVVINEADTGQWTFSRPLFDPDLGPFLCLKDGCFSTSIGAWYIRLTPSLIFTR